jgi:hypothetical protein
VSREDIIAVASRLLAVYLAVVSTQIPISLLSLPDSQPVEASLLFIQLGTAASILALAALLWFFPLTVARRLLPVMRDPQPPVSVPGALALSLALAVLGFWLLAKAVSDVVYWSTVLFFSSRSAVPMEFLPEHKADMVTTVVELAIAATLILGNRGIASWVRRLRYGKAADRQEQPGAL